MNKNTRRYSLLLIAISVYSVIQAQTPPPDTPAYLRTRQIPAFTILLPDSISYFYSHQLKKNMTTVMIWFNPDCEHCQTETKGITDSMSLFRSVQFVFATYAPLHEIKKFYTDYGLNRFDNIIMGRDEKYFLPTFYKFRYTPFVAVYSKEGGLNKVFEGGARIPVLAAACRE